MAEWILLGLAIWTTVSLAGNPLAVGAVVGSEDEPRRAAQHGSTESADRRREASRNGGGRRR